MMTEYVYDMDMEWRRKVNSTKRNEQPEVHVIQKGGIRMKIKDLAFLQAAREYYCTTRTHISWWTPVFTLFWPQ